VGVIKKTIKIDTYLKVFFEIYFKHDTLYITDDSSMWDILKYVGGHNKLTGVFKEDDLETLEVVFDETTKYMLDVKWDVYIKSSLKHLFWHKMYLYIYQYLAQGMSKSKAIEVFCERFELDGESVETEHLRRAMFRWSESDQVRNEILLGTITESFKHTKKLPKASKISSIIQLQIFSNELS
jgi:hypothetical protein